MAVVTEVLARISANTSGFTSGMRTATGALHSFESATMQAEGRTSGLFSRMLGATTLGPLLARGFQQAGQSVMGFGREVIGQAMQMQQAQMAFEQFLGGADKAKAKLEELRDFSAATPFEFPDLVESTKQMLALGFSADDVLKKVTDPKTGKTFFTGLAVDAGDAAAMMGQGTEGVERITRALGRMKLKGKATGEEMMMLTEGGLPAWKYLSQAMGKPVGELQKMMEKGLIPAEAAIAAVRKGMQGDFGGGMIKQSQTLQGLLSTLKDTIFGEFVRASGPLVESISKITEKMILLAQNVIPKLAAGLQAGIAWVTQFATAIGQGFQGVGDAADPLNQIGRGIRGFVDRVRAAISDFRDGLQGVAGVDTSIFTRIGDTVRKAFMWVVQNRDAVVNALAAILAAILAYQAVTSIIPTIQSIAGAFSSLGLVVAQFAATASSGGIVAAMGAIGSGIAAALGPVLLIAAAIAAVAAVFVLAYQHIESFRNAVNEFASAMAGIGSNILSQLTDWFTGTLMPVLQDAASVVRDNVTPAFNAMAEFISGTILPAVMSFAQTFQRDLLPGLMKAAEGIVKFGAFVIKLASFMVGKVIPVLLKFAGPVLGFIVDNLKVAFTVIGAVIGHIGTFISTIMDLVNGNISLGEAVSRVWNSLLTMIGTIISSIGGRLQELGRAILDWVVQAAQRLPGLLASFGATLLGWLGSALGWLGQKIGEWTVAFLSWLGQAAIELPGRLASLAGFIIGWIIGFSASLPGRIQTWVSGFLSWAGKVLSELPGRLLAVSIRVYNWASKVASELPGRIQTWVSGFLSWAGKVLSELPGRLASLASTIFGWISSTASAIPGQAMSIGTNIVSGVWQGIQNATGWLLGLVSGFAQSILNGIKAGLGISSPSRYTMVFGQQLAQGLVVGLNGSERKVLNATNRIARAATTALANAQRDADRANARVIRAQAAFYRASGKAAREAAQKEIDKAQAAQQRANALLAEAQLNADQAARRDPMARAAQRSAQVLEGWRQRAQQALDYMKQVQSDMSRFGSIANISGPDGTMPSATDIVANLSQRLAAIRRFSSNIKELKEAGLNPGVIQDIVGMGPVAGAEMAEALLAQKAMITGRGGINELYSQIQTASRGAADMAGAGVFGMNREQAGGVLQTNLNVGRGAITINFGDGVSTADKAAIRRDVDRAVRAALAAAAREGRR